jgi:hypothetical protein
VRHGKAAAVQPSYAWLFDVLLAGASSVAWAPAGDLPSGFELDEQFAAVPAIAGRCLLVSLRSRKGASSALTAYNALRPPRSRFLRRALGGGLRTGIAQVLLRQKFDIGVAPGYPAAQLSGVLLTEYLSDLLGCGPVVMAISGGNGPYRKPVLQVFSTDGSAVGFVKIGWNDWTRKAVRREAAGLRACASGDRRILDAPELIGHYEWRGLDLLITAPIPTRVRRIAVRSALPDVRVLREICQLSEPFSGELRSSPWWLGLRARIATVADTVIRAELDAATSRVEQAGGHTELAFGTWHGDFVPWNLAWANDRLFAWDWESSEPDAPVGFDALHFYFQIAFVAKRLPLEEATQAALRAGPALTSLGVPAAAHRLLAALHLLEVIVSQALADGGATGRDSRSHPTVMRVLDQLLASPPRTRRMHFSGLSS